MIYTKYIFLHVVRHSIDTNKYVIGYMIWHYRAGVVLCAILVHKEVVVVMD